MKNSHNTCPHYIELELTKNTSDNIKYTFSQIIDNFKYIVILGSPGIGKSTTLQHYNENNKNSQLINIKEFLKLKNTKLKDTTQILLFDGLDEYRTTSEDKTFVTKELANSINELINNIPNIKIVISCRDMDWYGDLDKSSLNVQLIKKDDNLELVKDNDKIESINKSDALNNKSREQFEVFKFVALDYKKQEELSKNLNINNRYEFLEKYHNKGFLDNTQMFMMIADIWKNDNSELSSKIEIFEKFFKYAKESNQTHEQYFEIENNITFKIVGYLAFFYIFCSVDEFNEDIIDEISEYDKGFSKKSIEKVLTLKLFNNRCFIHKTIAEYALAKYICENKINKEMNSYLKVKNLFVRNNKIPTQIRGTFAWLCSISKNFEFIQFDPYYQSIYGDNSHLQPEEKKNIILAIKAYSNINPYFYQMEHKMELDNFYCSELDELLMKELDIAFLDKNHYIYFIENIICHSKNLSNNIKEYIKTKICDVTITSTYKKDLLKVFNHEYDYILDILRKIKNDELEDNEDSLKDYILSIAVPQNKLHIDYLVEYLALYKTETFGYCLYLFDLDFNIKKDLVLKIHNRFLDSRTNRLDFPKALEDFISDYFLETILKFEELLTSKEIYDLLKYYNDNFYQNYEHISFKSFHFSLMRKQSDSDSKMQKLVNDLFNFYVDDILQNNNQLINEILFFDNFFNYKVPNNQDKVLLSKVNKDNTKEINEEILSFALMYIERDEKNIPIIDKNIKKIANEFNLNDLLDKRLNPVKQEWQIKEENKRIKSKNNNDEIKNHNITYYQNLSDEEFLSNENALKYFADLLFLLSKDIYKFIDEKTEIRLKGLLKKLVYENIILEKSKKLINIKSFAESSFSIHRNIDSIYYVSLCLNNGKDLNIENITLKKYLFILALQFNNVGNVIKTDFLNYLENNNQNEFIIETMKEFIQMIIEPNIYNLIEKYLNSSTISELKHLLRSFHENLPQTIISNFLDIHGFKMELNELKQLKSSIHMNDESINIIDSIVKFLQESENFDMENSIILHSSFSKNNYKIFELYEDSLKIKLIHLMLLTFNTEKILEHKNGIQSPKDLCASFLKNTIFVILNKDALLEILKLHTNDIWSNRLKYAINQLETKIVDEIRINYSKEQIKKYILTDSIVSYEDFFDEVFHSLEKLKTKIEDNRDEDILTFYNNYSEIVNNDSKNSQENTSKTLKAKKIKKFKSKTEEECRNILVQRLKDMTSDIFITTREQYEANNRCDINAKYNNNNSYEIQIECKKDINSELYTAIKEQLIDKYFSSKVNYGIYLIFYFGDCKDSFEEMNKKVIASIPNEYTNYVRIIVINLKRIIND